MKQLGAMHFLIGVIALVVGIGVGGLGPRAELRALRAQVEELGECESGSRVGSEIANVFRGRPWEGDAPPRKVTSLDAEPEPVAVAEEPEPAEPTEDVAKIEFNFGDGAEEPQDVEETMEMAREAMELRYAQARAALIEDANPSDEQMAEIDASMQRMNDSLMGMASDLVDQVSSDEGLERRDTMLFAAETLDLVLSAEEELRGTLTEDQIAALQDESLDPLSYVDPAIVDVLTELDQAP